MYRGARGSKRQIVGGVRGEVRQLATKRRVRLMRADPFNEFTSVDPPWPAPNWVQLRDRPPLDRDGYNLSRLHPLKEGPCPIPEFTRGHFTHGRDCSIYATVVAMGSAKCSGSWH